MLLTSYKTKYTLDLKSFIKRTVMTETITKTNEKDTTIPEKPIVEKVESTAKEENISLNQGNLDDMIEENARLLRNIRDRLEKNKSDISIKSENLNKGNIPPIQEVNTSISSSSIDNNNTNPISSSTNIEEIKPINVDTTYNNNNSNESVNDNNEIKPVSVDSLSENLDDIAIKINKIKLATQVNVEATGDLLRRNNIPIERTQQASERINAIINRAEIFIRSINSPGRLVMYTAFSIATFYSIYSVIRYQQLPLRGLLSSVLGAQASNQASPTSQSSSHVINIHYPESTRVSENVNNIATNLNDVNPLIQTALSNPWFYGACVAIIWILKKVPK